MGCCSKAFVIQGCCCTNAVVEMPPKLGCAQECMTCCISCKLCCAVGEGPLPWLCCGPTCACNKSLCKVKGTVFCIAITSSLPCDSDTPILCTIFPFCTVYPKVACCPTLDSLGIEKKEKEESSKEGVTMTKEGSGGPLCNQTMVR